MRFAMRGLNGERDMNAGRYSGEHGFTVRFFDNHFPNIKAAAIDWNAASKPSEKYNCMGFAVGDMKWWQPPRLPDMVDNPGDYWPDNVDKIDTIEAFIDAAKTARFSECETSDWEERLEKIVLCYRMVGEKKEFSHAAKLMSPGVWKSKFSDMSDVEHSLFGLDDSAYGNGRKFMRRTIEEKSSPLANQSA
jgi:hypothetical protein